MGYLEKLLKESTSVSKELETFRLGKPNPVQFGSIFEDKLDTVQRRKRGAYFTDEQTILKVINPAILVPFHLKISNARGNAEALIAVLKEIRTFRVLDPACGSGNFLCCAYMSLFRLEQKVIKILLGMGVARNRFKGRNVSLKNFFGIEIEPDGSALAKASLLLARQVVHHEFRKKPIGEVDLSKNILCQDALFFPWPAVDVIVGNPPFLAGDRILTRLGEDYAVNLRKAYKGRVIGKADLVCYWFEIARVHMLEKKVKRVGFVATSNVRFNKNRAVIDKICKDFKLYNAWSSELWRSEGAKVRIAIINFCDRSKTDSCVLDGKPVSGILPNLQSGCDMKDPQRLADNVGWCGEGIHTGGPFDIEESLALEWITHSEKNCNVLHPIRNAYDVVQRCRNKWVINFARLSKDEARQYKLPFAYVEQHVKPYRRENKNRQRERYKNFREKWWLLEKDRQPFMKSISNLSRYIATPVTTKHRPFVFLGKGLLPTGSIISIRKSDDATFGILHARHHELWALKHGTPIGESVSYRARSIFETFPFPKGLTPNIPAEQYANDLRAIKIAEAAKTLNELREAYLKDSQTTMTALYNDKPAWLTEAHRKLDKAVAEAYGWSADLSDREVLDKLLELNLCRSQRSKKLL